MEWECFFSTLPDWQVKISCQIYSVGENFFSVFNIKLAGNIPSDPTKQGSNDIVISESIAQQISNSTLLHCLGQQFCVIGVTKNFYGARLSSRFQPDVIMQIDPEKAMLLATRLDDNPGNALLTIKQLWNATFPHVDFKYSFLESPEILCSEYSRAFLSK